jgi:hypothetical protein
MGMVDVAVCIRDVGRGGSIYETAAFRAGRSKTADHGRRTAVPFCISSTGIAQLGANGRVDERKKEGYLFVHQSGNR